LKGCSRSGDSRGRAAQAAKRTQYTAPITTRGSPGMTTARKVALITGAGTGVGAATALMLAHKGYDVLVNYSRSATRPRPARAVSFELVTAAMSFDTSKVSGYDDTQSCSGTVLAVAPSSKHYERQWSAPIGWFCAYRAVADHAFVLAIAGIRVADLASYPYVALIMGLCCSRSSPLIVACEQLDFYPEGVLFRAVERRTTSRESIRQSLPRTESERLLAVTEVGVRRAGDCATAPSVIGLQSQATRPRRQSESTEGNGSPRCPSSTPRASLASSDRLWFGRDGLVSAAAPSPFVACAAPAHAHLSRTVRPVDTKAFVAAGARVSCRPHRLSAAAVILEIAMMEIRRPVARALTGGVNGSGYRGNFAGAAATVRFWSTRPLRPIHHPTGDRPESRGTRNIQILSASKRAERLSVRARVGS